MTLGESVRTCLAKYVTWKGRASRSEYWWFVLATFLASVAAIMLDMAIGTASSSTDPLTGQTAPGLFGIFYIVVALGTFLPSLSAMVRRLHDTNRSGWWYWIALVPFVGMVVLLVFLCSRGTAGPNRFGHDPLEGDLDATFA